MNRPFDTLRALLFDMERWPNQFKYRIQPVTVHDADEEAVNALVYQLLHGGYAKGYATVNKASGTRAFIPTHLTFKGQSLLNALRSDHVCAAIRAHTTDIVDCVPPGFLVRVVAVVATVQPDLQCSRSVVA